MKKLMLICAPVTSRSGYGSHARDLTYSFVDSGEYDVKILDDGWTAVTKDKSLSAQFEHTIGITENGYEIFTKSAKDYYKPPYK